MGNLLCPTGKDGVVRTSTNVRRSGATKRPEHGTSASSSPAIQDRKKTKDVSMKEALRNAEEKAEEQRGKSDAAVVKMFSAEMLDVSKQLENFEESKDSEFAKEYDELVRKSKVNWDAMGPEFSKTPDPAERKEQKRSGANKAIDSKVLADSGVVVPFLSIAATKN